jgi:WD40 repeat protein
MGNLLEAQSVVSSLAAQLGDSSPLLQAKLAQLVALLTASQSLAVGVNEEVGKTNARLIDLLEQDKLERAEQRAERQRLLEAMNMTRRRSFDEEGDVLASPRKAKSMVKRFMDFKGHTNAVIGVAFSRDGVLMASASADKTARVWESQTGVLVHTLLGHADYVRAVAFNHTGALLATGSSDNHVFVWSVRSGERVASLTLAVDGCAVSFSPDGSLLAVGSGETVGLWSTVDYTRQVLLPGLASQNAYAVVFSASGKHIAAGTDTCATIWDAQFAETHKFKGGHTSIVVDVCFSPDESRLATASWDKSVRIWSLDTRECLRVLLGHTGWVNAVSWSRDGCALVTGSSDCTMAVWDPQGKRLCVTALPKPVCACLFSPIDDVIVVGAKDNSLVEFRVLYRVHADQHAQTNNHNEHGQRQPGTHRIAVSHVVAYLDRGTPRTHTRARPPH